MAQLKMFECDVCDHRELEKKAGDGVFNWSQQIGVKLDDVDNPTFCPKCTAKIMNFVDDLKHKGG